MIFSAENGGNVTISVISCKFDVDIQPVVTSAAMDYLNCETHYVDQRTFSLKVTASCYLLYLPVPEPTTSHPLESTIPSETESPEATTSHPLESTIPGQTGSPEATATLSETPTVSASAKPSESQNRAVSSGVKPWIIGVAAGGGLIVISVTCVVVFLFLRKRKGKSTKGTSESATVQYAEYELIPSVSESQWNWSVHDDE
jgi:hypothetical protein